jgi:hypothetical protein
MKNRLQVWGLIIILLGMSDISFSQVSVQANQDQLSRNVDISRIFMDKMLGEWQVIQKVNTQEITTRLTVKRVIGQQFLQADLRSVDGLGVVKTEYLMILKFAKPMGKYDSYLFDNAGTVHHLMGEVDAKMIELQGFVPPSGMEHFRWVFKEDGKLEFSKWNPTAGGTITDKADTVYLFEKNSVKKAE